MRRPDITVPVILALVVAALTAAALVGSRIAGPPKSNPASADSSLNEGMEHARAGRIGEALKALDRAKRVDPKAVRPRLVRAQLLAASTRFRDAYDEMVEADRIAPNDHEVTMQLLRYIPPYLPPTEAEKVARKAVAQVPEDSEAWYRLGSVIAQDGRSERLPEALKALEESNRLAPMQPLTLVEMGKIHVKLRDSLRAVAELRAAWEILDRTLKSGRQPPEALLEYRRTTAFWLAQAYDLAGQREESQQMVRILARLEEQLRRAQAEQARMSAGR